MKILEPGHIYRLEWLDGDPVPTVSMGRALADPITGPPDLQLQTNDLIFVCREDRLLPHPGTQTQEVLRALIDRTMHCDNCLRWSGNDRIIYHLRMALALHEARALERKIEKGLLLPERITTEEDGHFKLKSPSAFPSEDAQKYHQTRKAE